MSRRGSDLLAYSGAGAADATVRCGLHLAHSGRVAFCVGDATAARWHLAELGVLQAGLQSRPRLAGALRGPKKRLVEYVVEALRDCVKFVRHVVEF